MQLEHGLESKSELSFIKACPVEDKGKGRAGLNPTPKLRPTELAALPAGLPVLRSLRACRALSYQLSDPPLLPPKASHLAAARASVSQELSPCRTMGNTFKKMFDSLFSSREMRVVMLGARGAPGRSWTGAREAYRRQAAPIFC